MTLGDFCWEAEAAVAAAGGSTTVDGNLKPEGGGIFAGVFSSSCVSFPALCAWTWAAARLASFRPNECLLECPCGPLLPNFGGGARVFGMAKEPIAPEMDDCERLCVLLPLLLYPVALDPVRLCMPPPPGALPPVCTCCCCCTWAMIWCCCC